MSKNKKTLYKAGALAPVDAVAAYVREIQKYPLLSKEQEYELAVEFRKTGSREAAHHLITSNLRFVVKVAHEYAKFGSRMIDLIQEGNVGLMNAVKEYDPYQGTRLITYAAWWIRGQIQDYLMKQYSVVKIGTTAAQRKLFYQLQKQKRQLEQLGLEAGVEQLSSRLGVPEKDVQLMSQRLQGRDASLSAWSNETGSLVPVDMGSSKSTAENHKSSEVQVDTLLEKNENLHLLQKAVKKLKPQLNSKELDILENRLLCDKPVTLQSIGQKYNITREAARQTEARVIAKLKKILN